MARRIGNSFSGADISLAADYGVAEVRANTPTYTYSLKAGKDGWGASGGTIQREYEDYFDAVFSELEQHALQRRKVKSVKSTDGSVAKYPAGEIFAHQWARINLLATHKATKYIAKKYGLGYSRVKRHERSASDASREA